MSHSTTTFLRPTPPLMNGLGLLLWGWQCDFLLYAVPMAVVLELARFIPWKSPISDSEFNHIADLSSVIFMLAVVYAFTTKSYHGIYTVLALMPFPLYLLILAQVYSTRGTIRPGALFISLRRLDPAEATGTIQAVDLSYPYLFVCLISASAGNHHASLFFIFAVALIGWVMWSLRPATRRPWLWFILIVIAVTAGYGGQAGMRKMQTLAEATFLEWFDKFMWRGRDPDRTTTAIGTIGRLKLSDRIMVRVDTHDKRLPRGLYLREASYHNYGYGVWTNYRNTLQPVDPTPDRKQWIINESLAGPERITISFYLDDKTSVIPAPLGLGSIARVGATQIEHSPFGAVAMELNPGWVRYDTLYSQERIEDAPPAKEELDLPTGLRQELSALVDQLDLAALPPAQRIKTVERFFAENFEYTLTQNQRYPKSKYLSKFLFETRKGHCEYFATATALLLRAADIPTRYVVGYATDEYSAWEGQYIARARHAHSWVLAYVDDRWQVVDTTPPVWAPIEAMDNSAIEPLIDFWSWISYRISTWNDDTADDEKTSRWWWLLLPILIYYLWKIFIKDRVQNIRKKRANQPARSYKSGSDSGFYRLAAALEARYFPRKTGETLSAWLKRMEQVENIEELRQLLQFHYRYRFDPAGLDRNEKQALEQQVNKQLAMLR